MEEIYIPGLTNPSLFQELPSLSGFQRILPQELAHQIYKEQLDQHNRSSSSSSSSYSPSQLIESCSWRALAIQARQQIIGSDPSETTSILQGWSYRFQALYELRQPRLIVREMLGLLRTINHTIPLTEILIDLSPDSISPSNSTQTGTRKIRVKKALPDIIPFDILILRARLPTLLSPHTHSQVIKTSDGLFELLEGCKRMIDYLDYYEESPEKTLEKKKIWRKRIEEIVKQLVSLYSGHGFQTEGVPDPSIGSMNRAGGGRITVPDRHLSISLVRKLSEQLKEEEGGDQKWKEMEIKIWLELGNLEQADQLLTTLDPSHPLHLVRQIIDGQFKEASTLFTPIAQTSLDSQHQTPDFSLINNLSIAFLYSGNLSQGFPIMHDLITKLTPVTSSSPRSSTEEEEADKRGKRPKENETNKIVEKVSYEWIRNNGTMNGLILNYVTWIELAFGTDSERIKRDFLIRLLLSYSSSSPTSSPSNTGISNADVEMHSTEFPLHRIADLINLNCFKFPASYFQSTT
ncbi:hypothetical protein MJO28_004094 [Puccinia striiformis f. sp. tritici]|uniref:Uncharacterized protein n=3 Tax=Puccinia striiformis TaxID=27350 RepID=A0A2S4WG75_9BASI|nr:hypothetical protein Pst134EB_008428 [Puccinia striiformis f. sp. tritici]KAI7956999.1 hypothetical protein MJO28_004094 [Puccinia striiformis f. sp. tritici]KAI9617048.1 hypothetical protein H4Q26_010686 [Puccinia striiformis f. sp. tritici PST-130]POW20707.1 hypothetical protein PSHT_03189 [Puccinia striiformis]